MTTDTQDRDVAVPHYKERLWRELARLHAAHDAGRLRGRRRAPRWVVSVAATAATAAAVAAVIVLQPSRDTVSGPDGETFAAAPVADRFDPAPGDVVSQLLEATERASGMFVVHTATLSASGETSDTWEDWTTRQYRRTDQDAHGVPMQEAGGTLLDGTHDPFGGRGEPDEVARVVDHCGAWYEDQIRAGFTGTPAWPFLTRGNDDPESTPDDLTAVADGTEVVDGRELARVRVEGSAEVMLVDPATSLPVQSTVGTGTPSHVVYEYLPRSEANLALLALPAVPDGYTGLDRGELQAHLDAPAWDPGTPVPAPDCPPLP